MHYVHNLNPVALQLGPIAIRWYGLMYLIGFALFLVLGRLRARDPWRDMSVRDVDDLLFFGMIGAIVGGRLGHVLFYGPLPYYLQNPLEIFAVWKGGMASHGGILGVIVAMGWFARSRGKSFLKVADFVVPLVPLGLGAGRIGNFINGELWGRVADPSLPWAVIFPSAGDSAPRHPSQIYQFGLEGLVLFAILWLYSRRPRIPGTVGSLFLIAYGVLRIVGELFKEPEALYGAMPLGLSAGQWLSLPMVLAGVGFWTFFHWRQRTRRGLTPSRRNPPGAASRSKFRLSPSFHHAPSERGFQILPRRH